MLGNADVSESSAACPRPAHARRAEKTRGTARRARRKSGQPERERPSGALVDSFVREVVRVHASFRVSAWRRRLGGAGFGARWGHRRQRCPEDASVGGVMALRRPRRRVAGTVDHHAAGHGGAADGGSGNCFGSLLIRSSRPCPRRASARRVAARALGDLRHGLIDRQLRSGERCRLGRALVACRSWGRASRAAPRRSCTRSSS